MTESMVPLLQESDLGRKLLDWLDDAPVDLRAEYHSEVMPAFIRVEGGCVVFQSQFGMGGRTQACPP